MQLDYRKSMGFCDGGEKAYGAVIFLRWELLNGSYKCVPVLIKSFVAPLKKKTIPRLELMGCLTLTRMYDTCRTVIAIRKYPRLQKNLLGRLLYCLIVDKDPITEV